MDTWEKIRHQVAIAGRVINPQTQQPIAGARVRITDPPPAATPGAEQLFRTATAANGHFHFLDLPDGTYTLQTSLPSAGSRYGAGQAEAVVTREAAVSPDEEPRIIFNAVDIDLPPTTLQGNVTGTGGAPVVLAKVRIQGSGEQTFSDNQGHYRLIGLETGDLETEERERRALVTAAGYTPTPFTFLFNQAGDVQTVDVQLTASNGAPP